MGPGRHQTVAGSGAGLISDLAFNSIRNPREPLVCSAEGHKTLCEKNNLSETKIEVSGVKLEINSFLKIIQKNFSDNVATQQSIHTHHSMRDADQTF
jgi:hypothetical protein